MLKQRNFGRKKKEIYYLFRDEEDAGKIPKVSCTFCGTKLSKNGTRMTLHLAKCVQCPHDVKWRHNIDSVIIKRSKTDKQKCEMKPTVLNVQSLDKCGGSEGVQSSGNAVSSEQTKSECLLARAIYSSAVPLNIVNNMEWRELFKFLRPTFEIPSRNRIAGPLLEAEFNNVCRVVSKTISKSASVAVMSYGWGNTKNEAVIKYIITTPKPLLYKIAANEGQSHTASFISQDIGLVIDEIGPEKVFGVITDHAPNIRTAWSIIKDKYSANTIHTYACFAHSLNKIFSDIKSLPFFKFFLAEATDVIKTMKQDHVVNTKIENNYSEVLKLPLVKRCDSIVQCFKILIMNKKNLEQSAMTDSSAVSAATYNNSSVAKSILNSNFWDKLQGYVDLLQPLADAFKIVEDEKPQLSRCLKIYKNIVENVSNCLVNSPLSMAEQDLVKQILYERKCLSISQVHLVANFLDPSTAGCDLTPDEVTNTIEFVYECAAKIPSIREDKVLQELASYTAKTDFFSKEFLWRSAEKLNPIAWWSGLCGGNELSKIATRFLELPATTTSIERSFKHFTELDTKKNNRDNEKSWKINYISHNLKLISDTEVEESPEDEDMSEELASCEVYIDEFVKDESTDGY